MLQLSELTQMGTMRWALILNLATKLEDQPRMSLHDQISALTSDLIAHASQA